MSAEPEAFAEVVILDETGGPVTIISDYEEWQVAERYYGVSSFRLEIDDDAVGADEIAKGRFLYERGAELVFRIEQLDREEVYDSGNYRSFMVCTGPAVGLLDDRIAIPPSGSSYDKISAAAGETAIMHYVRGHCAENASATRAVPSFGTAVDQGRGATVSKRARYQPISELIHEIGILSGVGWQTVYRQGESPPFVFEVIEGTDRSGEVFIEPSMDAVDEQALLDSILGKKTFALVAGQGEGDNRTKEEVWTGASEPSGWDRREVFVDARDLDDDEAAEGALTDRGNEKLEETQPGTSFTVEAAAFGEFVYGRDWFLGDILMIRNRNWNVEKPMRAISVTTSRSGPEVSIDVEFDQPWPTVKDRIREAFSGGTSPGSGAVDYPTDYVSASDGGEYNGHVSYTGAVTITGDSNYTNPVRIHGDGAASFDPSLFRHDTEIAIQGGDPQIEFVDSTQSAGTAGRRFWIRKGTHLYFLIDDNDDGAWDSPHPMYIEGSTGDVVVGRNFDVSGTKNARIADPSDPTIGYHFAAIEADEPGLLMHRETVTIPSGSTEASVDLPEHWSRIAKNPDAMVNPISGETTEQADQRVMPHALVDLSGPTATVRGLPGDYRVWVMASRADDAVADWQHVIDIPQEEEDI